MTMTMTIKEQREELEFLYNKYHRMLAFCDASEYRMVRELEKEAYDQLCAFEAQHNIRG